MVNIQNDSPLKFLVHSTINREGLDKKIYFPIFINNYRVLTCVDNGSDLTLMHASLFKKLFKNHANLLNHKNVHSIKSYTDTDITVLGQVSCNVKFTKYSNGTTIVLTIIADLGDSVPNFLFGNEIGRAHV